MGRESSFTIAPRIHKMLNLKTQIKTSQSPKPYPAQADTGQRHVKQPTSANERSSPQLQASKSLVHLGTLYGETAYLRLQHPKSLPPPHMAMTKPETQINEKEERENQNRN